MNDTPIIRKPRGFALHTPERRKQIARAGGIAAHAKGQAHQWNSAEAIAAAKKAHANNAGVHRFTPEEAVVAGRLGGKARARNHIARQMAATAIATTTASPSSPSPWSGGL